MTYIWLLIGCSFASLTHNCYYTDFVCINFQTKSDNLDERVEDLTSKVAELEATRTKQQRKITQLKEQVHDYIFYDQAIVKQNVVYKYIVISVLCL